MSVRSRAEIIHAIKNPGVVAVVRVKDGSVIPKACEALLRGGVTAIEITLTTPGAILAIRETSREFGREALVGAGTVLDASSCRAVLEAGAEFVVSPITRAEIAATAHEHDKPVMLGALTPTEAQTAFEAGADFIKLFPAEGVGPGYIRSLLAPLPHLQIVPTGGVELANAAEFIRAGCVALGLGSSLVSTSRLQRGQAGWDEMTEAAAALVGAVRAARRAGATMNPWEPPSHRLPIDDWSLATGNW